jgi:hypothetical protein
MCCRICVVGQSLVDYDGVEREGGDALLYEWWARTPLAPSVAHLLIAVHDGMAAAGQAVRHAAVPVLARPWGTNALRWGPPGTVIAPPPGSVGPIPVRITTAASGPPYDTTLGGVRLRGKATPAVRFAGPSVAAACLALR